MSDSIDSFSGEFRFLSNFWMTSIMFEGQEFPSSEHAYQAAKTCNILARRDIANLKTAGEAKRAGRMLNIRSDWEQVKLEVMEMILRDKFSNKKLAEQLKATGDRELIEGNTWNDKLWGVCNGVGENHLGRLLMKIRQELKGEITDSVIRSKHNHEQKTQRSHRRIQMGQDVSAEVAGLIGGAKVFGSSDNIRHGKYKMLIKKCFSEAVELELGIHKMSFVEMTPLEAGPNPQIEGDHVDYPGTAGPLKDDGNKPNMVGSNCALKVDHDGAGARSAGSNVKAFILALFNAQDGQIPDEEVNKTWIDLARRKPCKAGDIVGFDGATQQPIKATEDKQENPACGMIINCTTMTRKKKTPNEKGAYITKLIWSCASPIGTGENSKELVAKRRAEIQANQAPDDGDEEAPSAPAAPANGTQATAPTPPAPPAPPSPPAPPVGAAPFSPPAPWTKHTGAPWGATPDKQWYFSDPTKGGNNAVKSAAQLMAGQ